MRLSFIQFVVFLVAPAAAAGSRPLSLSPLANGRPQALSVRGGSFDGASGFKVDRSMALALTTAAMACYAAESAEPDYFTKKYTADKKYAGLLQRTRTQRCYR
jgi:hypothetical protein